MSNPRIIDNQRRTTLVLIDAVSKRMAPGRPFIQELRSVLAAYQGFGARDRRTYREIIFAWLRFRAWFDRVRAVDAARAVDLLIVLAPDVPELAFWQSQLGVPGGVVGRTWPEMCERLRPLSAGLDLELRELLPAWFESHCPPLFAERELLAQITRPPFWLRAQRGSAAELVRELSLGGIAATVESAVPGAVQVSHYVDLETHPVVASGRAEIQDIGSQALVAMTAPAPGSHWLDFCAGAGGKTLQLALALGPGGRVTAYDLRREALAELRRRMQRAGIRTITIEPVLPEPTATQFDGVLVDAPCSASGTWRRHPFLRHQTNLAVIMRYARAQLELLHRAAAFVVAGGRLVYATCSLSRRENEDVVAEFLRAQRDFRLEPPPFVPAPVTVAPQPGWVTLLPSTLDSDGYFLACLTRRTA